MECVSSKKFLNIIVAKKKKQINEFTTWGVNTKAPIYKIGLAPDFIPNADALMKHNYFQQKAEENETLYQKLRLVGDLDKMRPLIERVFMDLTTMRNLLDNACDDLVATKKQKRIMKDIQKTFDNFNSTLLTDVLKKLDELGEEGGAYAKENPELF